MRAYTPTKLTDNFFLGGATSLRGFGMWGAGPRQNGMKQEYIRESMQLRTDTLFNEVNVLLSI